MTSAEGRSINVQAYFLAPETAEKLSQLRSVEDMAERSLEIQLGSGVMADASGWVTVDRPGEIVSSQSDPFMAVVTYLGATGMVRPAPGERRYFGRELPLDRFSFQREGSDEVLPARVRTPHDLIEPGIPTDPKVIRGPRGGKVHMLEVGPIDEKPSVFANLPGNLGLPFLKGLYGLDRRGLEQNEFAFALMGIKSEFLKSIGGMHSSDEAVLDRLPPNVAEAVRWMLTVVEEMGGWIVDKAADDSSSKPSDS